MCIRDRCEFYLFENDDRGRPTRIPIDFGGYFDVAPLDAGENLRRDICLTMEQMGMSPQHSHHESGNGQNEIDCHHAGPLKTADNVMTVSYTHLDVYKRQLLVGGHPWVYENDILHSPENEPENGTLADVVSTKGSYLGTGFVSLKSKIRVRLISRNANDTFDAAFWRRRVEYAWNYRKTVLEPADLSACRVIFGEADQFPGLTVDRFSNILVTQTLSVGMEKLKPVLFPILAEVLRADGQTIDGIYERNDEALRAKEGLEQNKGWFELPGEPHPASTQTEICENGVYYHVDFENGQKTRCV